MFTENLFDEILVKPVREGATELLAVSGYVTVNMAYRHLDEPIIKRNNIQVRLVYGMALIEGVPTADHEGFKMLEREGLLECHYRVELPAVHSKVYVWIQNSIPVKAFVGSANYTQPGFGLGRNNGEAMAEVDPYKARDYCNNILQGALEVGHDDIEDRVRLYTDRQQVPENPDCRTVSLLIRGGEVPASSGLNWGFRRAEGYNRNLNEAYIQIGARIAREDFFLPRPQQFNIITDDGLMFRAVRAQKSGGGHAIQTPPPEGNSLLGAYFRGRLGLAGGTFVTRQHLDAYGRADVTLCRIDDENFFLDFAV